MNLDDFKTTLIETFCKKYQITSTTLPEGFNVATITDTVFLMIENDRELMSDYLHTVAHQRNLGYVNSEIAKSIKQYFGLQNAGENSYPNSNLIQSYTEFCLTE
jgi:hypothetical protein